MRQLRSGFNIHTLMFFFYIFTVLNLKNKLVFGDYQSSYIIYLLLFAMFFLFLIKSIAEKCNSNRILISSIIWMLLLIPSVLLSYAIDVSIFKFVLFSVGIIVLSLYYTLALKSEYTSCYRLIARIVLFNRVYLLLLSVLVYFLGLGYPVNATGFAGIAAHPQTYGVLLVFSVIFELSHFYHSYRRHKETVFLCSSVSLSLLFSYLTESRLSFFSILLVLTSSLFLIKFKKNNFIKKTLFIGSFILALLLLVPTIETVLSKSGRAEQSGLAALEESRGHLIYASINNFIENPITGIGFQVSNGKHGHYDMVVVRSDFFDMPTAAYIEKGSFLAALIDETGLLGVLGFATFLISAFYVVGLSYSTYVLFSSFLLVSMGESFLYSFGGLGSFVWVSFFLLLLINKKKSQNDISLSR